MNLADCYRQLGLRTGASSAEIKASYRRLARQYHPDMNPGDQQARDKFVALTEAYKTLMEVVQDKEDTESSTPTKPEVTPKEPAAPKVKITRKTPKIEFTPDLSDLDRQLKQTTYEQLQQLLKQQRYPRAIAIIEGLAQRLPDDIEIRQWQAITYQRCGRALIKEKQFDKARLYLKKALRTDPHNRSLWAEVEQDFRQMEQAYGG